MGSVVLIVGVILMVIVHEAAHFVAAKAFNIKATQAFFGFGPKLWSVQRGETEYGIKALPLGGYVRIIGMNPLEEVDPDDEGRTYREKPFYQKAVVVLAGIGSHFVVAFLIFLLVAVAWGRPGAATTEVAGVAPVLVTPAGDQPLELLANDEIISIDGVPLASGSSVWDKPPGAETVVEVDRDGQIVSLTTTDQVIVTPAYLAGIEAGDVLVEFAGVEVDSWDTFVTTAHANPGADVSVIIERGGRQLVLDTTLAVREREGAEIGYFGVGPVQGVERLGLISGMSEAGSNVAFASGASVEGLVGLVTNFDSIVGAVFSNESIPVEEARPISVIGLVRIAGPVEQALLWVAFVNVFVGILNVIPLYPLDGGHFAVALYEKLRGRPADVRKLLPVAAVVFVFIVTLGLLGLYLDIVDPVQIPG